MKKRPRNSPWILGALVTILAGCTGLSLVGTSWVNQVSVTTPGFQALPDGEYSGNYTLPIPAGAVAMARTFEVTVTLGHASGTRRITKIQVHKPTNFPDPAMIPTLTHRVIEAQRLSVDSFTGATYSSRSFLKAVEHALSR